ncbi:MAG: DUF3325 domain-containing protein [Zoogloeaceae bacterium]|nr:DUF3325 domain-containing protein [Zoogloeaceae bacterium]
MAEELLLIAGGTAWAGAALFALSQAPHWQASGGGNEGPDARQRLRLRGAGTGLLTITCAALFARDEAGFAALLCVLVTIAGAFATALTLAWRPRLLAPLRRLAGTAISPSSACRRSGTR